MAVMNAQLEPRTMVMTMDGESLGEVKEVREDCFKIDVRWGKDYWLPCSEVLEVDDRGATVCFTKADLGIHKLGKPGRPLDDQMLERHYMHRN